LSKAANRKNTADILKEQKQDRKKFFASRRQLKSGVTNTQYGNTTINNPAALSVSGGNFNIEVGWGDPLQGGNFTGPIAFNAVEKEIDGNKLTMASFFETPTSYCIVNGEGGSADDLANIITKNIDILGNSAGDRGALFNGQLLYLQAGDANITLKHNTGNIFMPSGSDLTLNKYDSSANTGGSFAILMWDDQNIGASSGRWVLVSSGTGSGGGGSGFVNPATTDLDMNTHDIIDLCRLEFDQAGQTLAAGTTGLDADADKLHFNVPTGDVHRFTVNNSRKIEIASSYLFLDSGVSMIMEDDDTIRPNNTTDRIGFHSRYWNDSARDGVGTQGTVEVPYNALTDWATESNLNSYFGESSGSCGVIRNSNGSANYKGRFYFKIGDGTADEGWYYVTAVKV
jgi:hypothetical protein